MEHPKKPSEVLTSLNKIFQSEMEGIVRYLHYSFMIMGHNRIPLQKWLRDQATESMQHAVIIGEKITALGGHPTMEPVQVEESNNHNIHTLLTESLSLEKQALDLYKGLVQLAVKAEDIALEELAREFVRNETEHLEEVQKMLRNPEAR